MDVDNSPGTNNTTIVKLPDTAIRESQDRTFSAIKNSGFRVARGNNVINLAPADIRKEGSALDLPIASIWTAQAVVVDEIDSFYW